MPDGVASATRFMRYGNGFGHGAHDIVGNEITCQHVKIVKISKVEIIS